MEGKGSRISMEPCGEGRIELYPRLSGPVDRTSSTAVISFHLPTLLQVLIYQFLFTIYYLLFTICQNFVITSHTHIVIYASHSIAFNMCDWIRSIQVCPTPLSSAQSSYTDFKSKYIHFLYLTCNDFIFLYLFYSIYSLHLFHLQDFSAVK